MDKIARLKDFVGPSARPSSSSKRARSGTHVPSCLVDGCVSDLSKCRDYHRRHKVCEAHSKTPIVTICGHQQRFCQQCSRFHSLCEFDNEKRSCRKRLDGHNRRRRKPQPDSLTLNPTYNQGTRFAAFHSPQIFPRSALAMSSNSESDTCHYSSQSRPESTMFARTEYPSRAILSLSPNHSDVAASCGTQRAFFSDWLLRDSSNCALSLLSSTSPPSSSAEAQAAQAQQRAQTVQAQYRVSSIPSSSSSGLVQYDGSESGHDYMFRIGPNGSSSSSGPNNHYRFPH